MTQEIRKATIEDIPHILDMGYRFYRANDFTDHGLNYSAHSFEQLVRSIINNPNIGVIIISEVEGIPAGSIGALNNPWLLDMAQIQVSEAWFWIDEDFRKLKIADKLIGGLLSYSKEIGAINVHMISLSNEYQKALNRFYRKFGFNELESTFIARL